ncbi:MAG TPA: hypothetical protein VJR89_06375 [Polyangiales bacterium]|nr:hypothetical protein [Polyangiales bacterium]
MSGRAALLFACLAAMSCTLPTFDKAEGSTDPSQPPEDAGEPLSCDVDLALGNSCRRCVAENCCAAAMACADGACGPNLHLPITPLTEVTPAFDELAACMLQHCDTEDTCDVRWGCVDNYTWPPLKQPHTVTMRVFNYADASEKGIPNISVKLCESTDPACSEDGGYITTGTTDSSGNVDFTVPKGFNGYFQLSGGGPAPSTVQWSQPVYDVVDTFSHQSLAQSAVQALAVTVGLHTQYDQPFEKNTGHLIARMQNCLPLRYLDVQDPERTARARDVVFRLAPDTGASRVFYINPMATVDLELDRTTWRGYGGAFQVPAVNVTVTARHAVTDKLLGSGTVTIRDGTIGFMYLVPNTGG